jgi:hypothetical protein
MRGAVVSLRATTPSSRCSPWPTPLTRVKSGTACSDPVYRYGASALPTSDWHSSNHRVDAVFTTP